MFTKMVVLFLLPVLNLILQEASIVFVVQSFHRKVLLYFIKLEGQSPVSFFQAIHFAREEPALSSADFDSCSTPLHPPLHRVLLFQLS